MQTREFVKSYFNAWNQHDPQGVAEHLTPDGIYRDVPEKVSRTHDELIQSLSSFFADNSHRYDLVGEIVHGHSTIAFQYRILPDSSESGSKIYSGAEFMNLSGDAAATITDYYDVPATAHPRSSRHADRRAAPRRKYAKSGLCEEQMLDYKHCLQEAMREQQMFLQPDLTLPRLAKEVGCSVNHLSQVINAGLGMSFFEYINQYRVQRAMALLSEDNPESNLILNIAFAVGFNSNSAFYAAFKKSVGQTPAQYRKQQLAKPH